MKKVLKYFLLLSIFLFFIFTRFYKLGSAPDSLIIDEAHHGYISYSLLKTGKDEHASNWPLVFKGFGDYKLPAYPYLLLPILKFSTLNNFAVRLPSALAGILIVFGIYLLFLEWGFKKKLSLLAALIMAFSPWSFILSRFAYESNLGLMFFVFALLFFSKGFKSKKQFFFFISSILFALTTYSYVSFKMISFIMIPLLVIYLFFKDKDYRKSLLVFILPFLLLLLPFFLGDAVSSNLARFKQVNFLGDGTFIREINEKRALCVANYPQKACYLFWNKGSIFLRETVNKFIELYSPSYLFSWSDQDLNYMNVKNTGQFLTILLPFYLLGIVYFIKELFSKKNKNKNLFYLFLLAIFLTPIPAVMSGLQKVRLSALLPFLILLLVWGYQYLEEKFKKHILIIDFTFLTLFLLSFLIYFINFSSVHVIKNDFYYDSFAKKIFLDLKDREDNYNEIVIDNFFSDPLMYYAYYNQIDPQYYQDKVVLGELEGSGFQHAKSLGKYSVARSDEEITEIACRAFLEDKEILYVTNRAEFVKEKKENDFLVKIVKSVDEVMDYAFIYDLHDYGVSLAEKGKCL